MRTQVLIAVIAPLLFALGSAHAARKVIERGSHYSTPVYKNAISNVIRARNTGTKSSEGHPGILPSILSEKDAVDFANRLVFTMETVYGKQLLKAEQAHIVDSAGSLLYEIGIDLLHKIHIKQDKLSEAVDLLEESGGSVRIEKNADKMVKPISSEAINEALDRYVDFAGKNLNAETVGKEVERMQTVADLGYWPKDSLLRVEARKLMLDLGLSPSYKLGN